MAYINKPVETEVELEDEDDEKPVEVKAAEEKPIPNDEFCRAIFQLIDKNDDGFISIAEFRVLVEMLGINKNDPLVERVFKGLDLDGDKQLNFEEVKNAVAAAAKDISASVLTAAGRSK